jgi:hypothetical protein
MAHAEGNPQAGNVFESVVQLLAAIVVANRGRHRPKLLAELFTVWREGRNEWALLHGVPAAPSEATWTMACSTLRSWP